MQKLRLWNVGEKFDPALRSLLKKMLAPDPSKRPTAEEILKKKLVKNWYNRTRIYRVKEQKRRSNQTEINLSILNET